MDFVIPKESEKVRLDTREFVKNELEPFAEEVESNNEIPPHIIQRMKEKGYFGLRVPKEYGGKGISKLGLSLIQEEMSKTHVAYVDLISINNGLGSYSIILEGSEIQKRKYLPKLAAGEIISAFALTEPNAGSDAASITTRAERKGNDFILNGLKHYTTNAPIADLFIVMAVTDTRLKAKGGISAFIVEKGTPGLSIGSAHNKMGYRGTHQSEVIFENVPIPAENLVGKIGQGLSIALKTIDEARIEVGAIALGMAERLLELSIEHARKTTVLGRALSESQSLQWILADMATELYATRLMVYYASIKKDRGKDTRLEAAMCKLYASEMLGRLVDRAFEIFGSEGYSKGSLVERMCRDARLLRIFDGTSEIHRIVIGRETIRDK
jgi:acyl-CoA dehydrogenase